ncbi:MAG: glycogen debranching N-terminal domain-containing protein [Nitrospirales bacterium]|nr:amylo-alpha-1,6-glucosidase [Nitrospirales bacterium]
MEKKIIRIGDEHYILATSALADARTHVLKHGETFGIFNPYGDIQHIGLGEQGLYHEGTRFLSKFEFNLEKSHPFLLSSTIKSDNALLAVDLTNPDLLLPHLPRGTLHISRTKLLYDARCLEQFRFTNYSSDPLTFVFSIQYEVDFADLFEVRGEQRSQRGVVTVSTLSECSVLWKYQGLDHVQRATQLTTDLSPKNATTGSMDFELSLGSKDEKIIHINVTCSVNGEAPVPMVFSVAQTHAASDLQDSKARFCALYSGNEQFNDWLNRSLDDVCMMTTDLPQGPYPYAGVPWFSTPFGRDGIITALECLWINPDLARGVLNFLASTQATDVLPEQDAEPGKILHETRKGEMAALKEIPFAQYYGSVDSTPLFILLAGAYYDRTGDKDFIVSLWPHVDRALAWIDQYGDKDRDGFVEYFRQTPTGLAQQGWKDSYDSIFHADGTLAEGPIALCEVQGYVYGAKRAASNLAEMLGYAERAATLLQEAHVLKDLFNRTFWSDTLNTYVLALDGNKHPCVVRSTNAGHTLFTEIAQKDRVERMVEGLLEEEFFSGWGIRTIPTTETRYNPMAYHNGSIWPHDNALIALGMSRYGWTEGVERILGALFDMSIHVELRRLPELICGFTRKPGESPILYPVACAPQAWAAGAVFLLLQACLGMSFQGTEREIRFTNPYLPEFLPFLKITNLRMGKYSADLELTRTASDVMINVTRKDDDLNIVTVR